MGVWQSPGENSGKNRGFATQKKAGKSCRFEDQASEGVVGGPGEGDRRTGTNLQSLTVTNLCWGLGKISQNQPVLRMSFQCKTASHCLVYKRSILYHFD